MKIERFEIKEKHLKLLKNAYVSWDDCEYGAPTIDPKRPYGNSFVEGDIARILGWEINGELSDKQYKDASKIHDETRLALQICLYRLKFETGVYENNSYGIQWIKVL
ncbi:hypothetical protein M0Q97_12480 [Candidatus Dojkabacteria bacterium]|jgi:hypothetical protein|nr:hypothetical protein [Candidatus Dojkabacteria bacterium]